jgi:oligopeptide/dipeptide ABC transporter ATP-binding protein
MEARDVSVQFRQHRTVARAIDGVTLDWRRGEILGVVGESGCGKSTLARALLGLVPCVEGQVAHDGEPIAGKAALRGLRRRVQMIFQDPYQTLNPRQRVRTIVAEPLRVQGVPGGEHEARVQRAMEDVGLEPERFLERYPHQLSGGQRQRVAIAAALVLEPDGLICDEPVSMLDVSVRAQILEQGNAVDVIERPQHPYTQALVNAVPVPTADSEVTRVPLEGELPDATNVPPGCRFHPRCPKRFEPCDKVDPPLLTTSEGQLAACLLHDPALAPDAVA